MRPNEPDARIPTGNGARSRRNALAYLDMSSRTQSGAIEGFEFVFPHPIVLSRFLTAIPMTFGKILFSGLNFLHLRKPQAGCTRKSTPWI